MSVYNGGRTLGQTISSVLQQRHPSFEFIVIDDGSTDNSAEILIAAAEDDPRLVVLRQENQGLTAALKVGCELARGRFIARQDSGDLSDPDRLFVQSQALSLDPRLAFVSCFTRFVGPNDEYLWTETGQLPDEAVDIIAPSQRWGVRGGPTHHGSTMMTADAYRKSGGYRIEFYYGQDWDLWYRLAAVGTFRLIHEVLYTARIEASSISSSARDSQMKLAELSLEAMRNRSDEPSILERAKRIRPTTGDRRRGLADGYYFIGEVLRRRRDARCRAYFWKAVAEKPSHIRSWVRLAQSLELGM